MSKILVVEDDENLRVALVDNLCDEGYEVEGAADAAQARAALEGESFALVILDIMLPDGDGYSVCRELQAAGRTPRVLMLTARSLEEDIVRGLDAGADDYLVKPYRLQELLARVRALLRRAPDAGRAQSDPARADARKRIPCGHYQVDTQGRQVFDSAGQAVRLTRTEFDLLAFLLEHPDTALTREDILRQVWGQDVIVDDRTVDNFVSSLKKKLGRGPAAGFEIRTVRGVGYRLELK